MLLSPAVSLFIHMDLFLPDKEEPKSPGNNNNNNNNKSKNNNEDETDAKSEPYSGPLPMSAAAMAAAAAAAAMGNWYSKPEIFPFLSLCSRYPSGSWAAGLLQQSMMQSAQKQKLPSPGK